MGGAMMAVTQRWRNGLRIITTAAPQCDLVFRRKTTESLKQIYKKYFAIFFVLLFWDFYNWHQFKMTKS